MYMTFILQKPNIQSSLVHMGHSPKQTMSWNTKHISAKSRRQTSYQLHSQEQEATKTDVNYKQKRENNTNTWKHSSLVIQQIREEYKKKSWKQMTMRIQTTRTCGAWQNFITRKVHKFANIHQKGRNIPYRQLDCTTQEMDT